MTGSNVKIGDAAVIRGTIDASTHVSTSIGSQTNISGPVHVNITHGLVQPSVDEIIRKAKTALGARDYQLAGDLAKQAGKLDPNNPQVKYIEALALLRSRPPKLLALDEIQALERLITSAIAVDRQYHYLCFLALVRDEFYGRSGMRMPSPNPVELMLQAETAQCRSDEVKFLLAHLPAARSNLYARIEGRCV